jgi:hypothetical protein
MPYSKHPRLKRAVQIGRAAAYGMLVGAGGTIFIVGDPPYPWRYATMAFMLLVGGAMCLAGQLADRWLGELLGLPLVASAMATFGVLVFRDAGGWTIYSTPNILILLGIGVLFFMRWVDQFMLARSARFMAHHGRTTEVE